MIDSIRLLQTLLEKQQWAAALEVATTLVTTPGVSLQDRAFCYFAQCRALSNLGRYSAALEPGQRAVHMAGEQQGYDLLGRALVEVAWAQYWLQMYSEARTTLERYLADLPRYSAETRSRQMDALFNLGTIYRALGEREMALTQFIKAWEMARRQGDSGKAEHVRSTAVWEAIEVGRLDVADRLLPHGEQYLRTHPGDQTARAMHLLDLARYGLAVDDIPAATARALESLTWAENQPALMARAFLLLYNAARRTGDQDLAAATGMFALRKAEQAERFDLMAEVQEALQALYLQHPEALFTLAVAAGRPRANRTGEESQ